VGAYLPYPLRFLFAAQPQVLGQVLGVVYRASIDRVDRECTVVKRVEFTA
jgi:hypothetical protein